MQLTQTEFIKTVNPDGERVVVQFWRPNDKYARHTWYLGGEKLLEISPDLAELGYTAAHFDKAGGDYQVPVNISWTPSAKLNSRGNPYKDVQRIEVR